MKNRKRVLLIAALALLLAVLLGVAIFLGQNANGMKVGICFRQLSDSASQEYQRQLEVVLQDSGFQTVVEDAQNDQSKQDAQIGKMLADGCKLLIVEPVIISAADTVVEQLCKADVPLVFINREPAQQVLESWEKISYVGCDTKHAGTVQGQIAAALPNKGDINGDGVVSYVMLQADETLIDTQLRSQSCIEAMTEAGAVLNCLGTVSTDGTAEISQLRCAQLLAQYGKDIEVIFCNTDAIALGALEAVKGGGWGPGTDIYLLGIGGSAEALEKVAQDQLTGTVVRDVAGLCDTVRTVVTQMLAGDNTQKIHHVDFLPVTKP